MAKIYQHEYLPVSVYGNVVSLLGDQRLKAGLHLDIGCGYGAIAEPITELGLTYVGFDIAADGLQSLRERGFEVHQIDLQNPEQAEATIWQVIGERDVASLTFIDTLEHITNGPAVLEMLRRLADRDAAPLVLSVPNVTHKDLALKLLIGRWDITEAGLLDYTHVGFYSQTGLSRLMGSIGWRELGARDWLLEHSDQQFPLSAPLLNHKLPIGHLLRRLVDQANPVAIVNQFVRVYRPGEPSRIPVLEDRSETPGPFLSILISVAARQTDQVAAILRNLRRQTSQDFEVVVVIYPCQVIDAAIQTDIFARLPAAFRRRVRFIASPHEQRFEALNSVLPKILGRYAVVLGEDDSVEPHWCATFAALGEHAGGAALRSHYHMLGNHGGHKSAEADKELMEFAAENFLPFGLKIQVSIANVAMPAGLFRDLGLRFDPKLGPAAAWDVVTQAALLCGLTASSEATVLFNAASDAPFNHGPPNDDDQGLLAKLNAHPLLLPVGSAERIQRTFASASALKKENGIACADAAAVREENVKLHADAAVVREENISLARALTATRSILAPPLLHEFVTSQTQRLAQVVAMPHAPLADDQLFLSIITRTQGTRSRMLRDVLMCLAGQSCQDFELLIVVHSLTGSARAEVEDLVAEFPSALRQRIRVLACTRPGRAAPLNDATCEARGRYLVFLDDDDFVFGHWVETFRNLAQQTAGAVLRAVCTRQDFELVSSSGSSRPRATSWFRMDWPATYDAVAHLHANYTPFMSIAFPAEAFRNFGFRFDESLSTTEDWELTNRVAMLCGVATTPDVTSVYRWWTNAESSAFLHPTEEWNANRQQILQKQNSHPVLLPPGATQRITSLIEREHSLTSELEHLRARNDQLTRRNDWMSRMLLISQINIPWDDASAPIEEFSNELLQQQLKSRSWRWTTPLRRLVQLLRGREGSGFVANEIPVSFSDCQRRMRDVRKSTSWRITSPIRAMIAAVRRAGPQ